MFLPLTLFVLLPAADGVGTQTVAPADIEAAEKKSSSLPLRVQSEGVVAVQSHDERTVHVLYTAGGPWHSRTFDDKVVPVVGSQAIALADGDTLWSVGVETGWKKLDEIAVTKTAGALANGGGSGGGGFGGGGGESGFTGQANWSPSPNVNWWIEGGRVMIHSPEQFGVFRPHVGEWAVVEVD